MQLRHRNPWSKPTFDGDAMSSPFEREAGKRPRGQSAPFELFDAKIFTNENCFIGQRFVRKLASVHAGVLRDSSEVDGAQGRLCRPPSPRRTHCPRGW